MRTDNIPLALVVMAAHGQRYVALIRRRDILSSAVAHLVVRGAGLAVLFVGVVLCGRVFISAVMSISRPGSPVLRLLLLLSIILLKRLILSPYLTHLDLIVLLNMPNLIFKRMHGIFDSHFLISNPFIVFQLIIQVFILTFYLSKNVVFLR